ncbi:HlyD family efflux transporter periplasmic adaptor subunit [Pseudohalioglobus lutimaris]|uniref:HlyD family efflux transporter periplasmic adaptor subunit n=1 Tax=Pseudohalioglobus lutimaris TaxID=1737061 RepID=UPI00096B707D|nr:HlyD family efflux transporter periplasmic adaptor subunit [Pseudohalioglobus lutimaris]
MAEKTAASTRKKLISLILLVAIIAGAVYAARYYWQARWYEVTENAYLSGNMVEVSAQIGGTVVFIDIDTNEAVDRGQELLRLADGDELQTLELRKQELALAAQEVLTLRAEVKRLEAEQRLKGITYQRAREDLDRRERLFPQNMVSEEELDAAQTRAQETGVALEAARLALQKARVKAGAQTLSQHPRVMAAAAGLRSAYRDWRKTAVYSPVAGEIARRRVQAGQRIAPGTPLFSIVQRQSAWVEANFKETQLRYLRPGQPVSLRSDLYGNDVVFSGTVHSIGLGTGSVFSLLPPQNATGNWIKIVQRVPVRIELDAGFDREHPLPFGASLQARVNTRDRSGPALVARKHSEPIVDANIYAYQDEGVEDVIADIIRRQGGE